ncbi:hypothetical protein GC098_21700 [Paenibacillus sp. LMG 31458]|uniref:Adenosine deaminase domain-containing protein n=1 Tax=Paenibacillus phytorum TaxID=2654977 RepID=A0ABX1Y1J1_9BACL|nr:hypothetical protein [Paenibacillus phytorum]NOU73981.1 hypothetical protein [Paenibacillus phytorum]
MKIEIFREPLDLRAELLTLPFTSLLFNEEDPLEKIAQASPTSDKKGHPLNKFKEMLYQELNVTHHLRNLDEIDLLLQKYFPFKDLQESYLDTKDMSGFYMKHLSKLSRLFITHRNGKITFKYWGHEEDTLLGHYKGINKVAFWQSLNRCFSTDLLVFIHLLENNMDDETYLQSYRSTIHLEDKQLDQILQAGVADTHLHFSAGRNFALNWIRLTSPHLFPPSRMTNELWGRSIDERLFYICSINRVLLGLFLARREQGNLSQFYGKMRKIELMYKIAGMKSFRSEENLSDIFAQLIDELDLLHSDGDGHLHTELDSLYKLMPDEHSVENLFLFRALKYLQSGIKDTLFQRAFWNYIRIKNTVFRMQVQANHTRGLEYFQRFFKRSSKSRVSVNPFHHIRYILQTQFDNPYLRKLEVRLSPPTTGNYKEIMLDLARELIEFLRAYHNVTHDFEQRGKLVPALGVVYHLIKSKDNKETEKCWMDFFDSGDERSLYFRSIQKLYGAQMDAIVKLRESVPELSYYLVGVDAASNEKWTEPWVFTHIFRNARNSDKHRTIYQKAPYLPIQTLGITYHVGEDYRHILTALRHVDEVVEKFNLHAGDRIGHGAVLGVKPQEWILNNPVIVIPRIEYIENLLWLWGLEKKNETFSHIYLSNLEKEILYHAKFIYGEMDGIHVYSLWQAYEKKFNPELNLIAFNRYKPSEATSNFPSPRLFCNLVNPLEGQAWNVEKLFLAYHCKCYLTSMLEPIEVSVTSEDVLFYQQIQSHILVKVSSRGIVVETNPSSNTAITEVDHIFGHYIQELNSRGLKGEHKIENGLICTINTDDPVVFNTTISNEFAYIYYSLLEKGHAREDVLRWIDRIRFNGMRTCFIIDRQITNLERLKELERVIGELEELIENGISDEV